jgi:predicted DNA binding CopG/RHH family protein
MKMIKKKQKKLIPECKSEVQEQKFWDSHSAMNYEMELVDAEIKIDPMARTRLVSLRLSERMIADLKEIAREEGLAYQTLIKRCLQKFVEVRRRTKMRAATPTTSR